MNFGQVIRALTEHFPELQPLIDAERSWWNDNETGQYWVMTQVFNPFVRELLKNGSLETLHRVGRFLDELATSKDVKVEDLLGTGILENFNTINERNLLIDSAGPLIRKAFDEMNSLKGYDAL